MTPTSTTGDEMTEKLEDVVAFLLGEKPLRGHWFGDTVPTERGTYWWRTPLRQALTAWNTRPDAGEPVGVVGSMPGTSGFTMASFEAAKVPVGTPLYTRPSVVPDREGVARIIDPHGWACWDEIRRENYGAHCLNEEPEGRTDDPTCRRWQHADYTGQLSASLVKADAILSLLGGGGVPAGEVARFAHDFVTKQSCGEWGADLIASDAKALTDAILSLLGGGGAAAGWKLVPVEPTREMWAAAGDAVVKLHARGVGNHDAISEAVWAAMLSASTVEG